MSAMNKIERCTLHVIMHDNKVVEVEANALGGREGVFATCRNPNDYNEVWFLSGDDGFWYFRQAFNKDWVPGIIATFMREKM